MLIFLFAKYLLDLIPNYILKIKIYKDELCIIVDKKNLRNLIFFLKYHSKCKFIQLIDVCGIDFPNKEQRFKVVYNLLSLSFNFRLRIKVSTDEITPIPTISDIYKSSL